MNNTVKGTALLLALVGAGPASALEWMNNSVGFRYGKEFTNPNNPNDIAKRIYSFTHASGYQYGSNFFNLDVLLSDSNDPRKGTDHGSSEVYGVYRNQVFASRVFDRKFDNALVKDYAFTLGFDASRNNNRGNAKKRAVVFGPTLKLNTAGFTDFSVLYYKEKNHSGIPNAKHPDHTFDATYMLSAAWMRPFEIGGHAAKFQGMLNYTGEKGEDYNDKDTAPETLMRAALMVAARPGKNVKPNLYFGVGYEYWHNKFGVDGGRGSRTSTPTLNMELTF
ncbi:nucleoside-binding protein [Pseudomonas sp. LS44]|uniref:nucleoside-binding protein n=1 Tax=Pseudomonas sp. LS44 TaxID=1357074 RepID=UPI00215A12B6|nr:nucleoside-binding protein [Pseudomonas sp. LS44]UVE18395.1 nucleoside-binding protein [Pseudomonas sp. LS44]